MVKIHLQVHMRNVWIQAGCQTGDWVVRVATCAQEPVVACTCRLPSPPQAHYYYYYLYAIHKANAGGCPGICAVSHPHAKHTHEVITLRSTTSMAGRRLLAVSHGLDNTGPTARDMALSSSLSRLEKGSRNAYRIIAILVWLPGLYVRARGIVNVRRRL
jgi:hypothetical protein